MRTDSMQKLKHWGSSVWEHTQVELQGHYSVYHLHSFGEYQAETSWQRAMLICFLAALPSLVVVLLLDLIRLEPMAKGATGSPNVWIRHGVAVVIVSVTILEQFYQHLPELELRRTHIVVISVVSAIISTLFMYATALIIGYPLPFAVLFGTCPWFVFTSATLFLLTSDRVRQVAGLTGDLFRCLVVLTCQVMLTIVYPLFNFAYKSLTSWQQTASVLLLVVMKLVANNWISRFLPDSDHARPEAVVFNVEIFHSLFVSLCMGNTTSLRTIALLIAADLVQAWLSFRDVYKLIRQLRPVTLKLDAARGRAQSILSNSRHGMQMLSETAYRIVLAEPFQEQPGSRYIHRELSRTMSRSRSRRSSITRSPQVVPRPLVMPPVLTPSLWPQTPSDGPAVTTHAVLPAPLITAVKVAQAPQPLPSDLASLSVVERGILVQRTQKLLYITEFVALIEYTEVIMPLIYSLYTVALYYMPNRPYYSFLEGITTANALYGNVSNVLLYALLEFLSLVLMAAVLWWKLRFSLVHQLAYVLETRSVSVQAKIVLWVVYVIHSAVIQLGSDYSFRFAWLQKA